MFRAVEEVLLRLKELLFPSIAAVAVLSVDVNIAIVRVDAQCTADGAACPVCGTWSNRVHGSYLRFPADVPSGGRRVVLQLKVRRFTCGNSDCARRTFVEQIPGLTRRHSQRTERLRSTLASVGLALAGRAGPGPASPAFSAFPSAAARCFVWWTRFPTPTWPHHGLSALTSTRPGRAATTAPPSSTSRPAAPSTCCPTGRRPAWRPGSPRGRALR
ncbi:transposase family protein [Streptomyces sp. NPDC047023]|uniref:transposase family protein n=1 Tax=Streptomyces sp. NPDC047023 TaxID=3155139 RepID=UPI0033FEB342